MPVAPARTPLAEDKAPGHAALLVVDIFSGWDFEDAEPLAARATRMAPRLGALLARGRRAGVPVVFVNDNQGRWRSDAVAVVRHAATASAPGRTIGGHVGVAADDYFVLKPKHSAFFATPLDLLLRHLRVRRLWLAGVAADRCVLLTAIEARMRDYDVVAVADCVAAQTARDEREALRRLDDHQVEARQSRSIRFAAPPPRRRAG